MDPHNALHNLDQLAIRYVRDRVLVHPKKVVLELFPGTPIPCGVSTVDDDVKDYEIVYKEKWICCGEYSCAPGPAYLSNSSRRKKCSASMTLHIEYRARNEEFKTVIQQDPLSAHGETFVYPVGEGLRGRYTWRSKEVLARACAAGVTSFDEILSDTWWPTTVMPRPSTHKERASLKRRWVNIVGQSDMVRLETELAHDPNAIQWIKRLRKRTKQLLDQMRR